MSWVGNIHRKAEIIHGQIAWWLNQPSVDSAAACAPYYELLKQIYSEDLPFALVMDESDIVFRMNGPAVDRAAPTMAAVTNVFKDIREQIGKVARAIVGLAETEPIAPFNVDLALSGMAKGSLVIGVKIANPCQPESGENYSVFGDDEPLTLAVRSAVRQIAVVTRYLSEEGIDPALAKAIHDPAIRDTVVIAAHQLSPSGRNGIDKVQIFSADQQESGHTMTPKVRRAIASNVKRPVRSQDRAEFVGTIREIDLDAKRFEVRGVRDTGSIRCYYSENYIGQEDGLLNQHVRVSGLVERLDGKPRLMQVEQIEAVFVPSNGDLF